MKNKNRKAKQQTPRPIASRANGRKGGLARAARLTDKAIQAIAAMGGKQLHNKYGDDYFSHIANRRWKKNSRRVVEA